MGHVTCIIGGSQPLPRRSHYIRQGQIFADVAENRWSIANPDPNAKYPRMSTTRMENNLQKSTYWQRDMSFLRLKNAEIGYTLPKAWTKKAGLSTRPLLSPGREPAYVQRFRPVGSRAGGRLRQPVSDGADRDARCKP